MGVNEKAPRRRAVWSAAGWTPSAEQDAILADLEDQAGPRAEWANARKEPEASTRRGEIYAEIARLHDVARRAGIPVDHIAGAVGVSPQQLHNIVKQARGA
jgi:hypothetical protein